MVTDLDIAFCGKNTVRRSAVGIWVGLLRICVHLSAVANPPQNCKACKKVIAGGAYAVSTPAAAATRSTLRRLREITES